MPDEKITENKQLYKANKQRDLLDTWIAYLSEFPAVEVVWVEGSMATPEKENPGSDIDIRFAIDDKQFYQLWDCDRAKLFEPLGPLYRLAPFRVVTESGILIEFEAHRTSEVINKKVYEWKILLNRLEDGKPGFSYLDTPPKVKWPFPHTVDEKFLNVYTTEIMRLLSAAATPFYHKTPHSALFALDILRSNLNRVLYIRSGVKPFARFKHLGEVLCDEYMADYAYAQFLSGEDAFGFDAIARSTLRCFEMLIKHNKALYEQLELEHPEQWFNNLYCKLADELSLFIKQQS